MGEESEKVECSLDTDIAGLGALILFGWVVGFNSCASLYGLNCNLDYELEADERRADGNERGLKLVADR